MHLTVVNKCQFETAYVVNGICVTSSGYMAVREFPCGSVDLYTKEGAHEVELHLPKNSAPVAVAAYKSWILVTDYRGEEMHIMNENGSLCASKKLHFRPGHICCVDDTVYVHSKTTDDVYELKMDGVKLISVGKVCLHIEISEVEFMAVNEERIVFKCVTMDLQQARLFVCDRTSYDVLYEVSDAAIESAVCAIAIDAQNRLYITERDNGRVAIVDGKGKLMTYLHIEGGSKPLCVYVSNDMCYVGCADKKAFVYKLDWGSDVSTSNEYILYKRA